MSAKSAPPRAVGFGQLARPPTSIPTAPSFPYNKRLNQSGPRMGSPKARIHATHTAIGGPTRALIVNGKPYEPRLAWSKSAGGPVNEHGAVYRPRKPLRLGGNQELNKMISRIPPENFKRLLKSGKTPTISQLMKLAGPPKQGQTPTLLNQFRNYKTILPRHTPNRISPHNSAGSQQGFTQNRASCLSRKLISFINRNKSLNVNTFLTQLSRYMKTGNMNCFK